jgi:starch synthase (maltosyl-transferring)
MSFDVDPNTVPFIYNLFPPLAGQVSNWMEHVRRSADLGYNWVFLNPIQYPGESGSLYSVRDYDKLNPKFFPQETPGEQWGAFGEFVKASRQAGVEVMLDLVINHTAHDSPLIQEHPEWYKWQEDGRIFHPGAMDNGHWVIWGDLAEIDNENSSDKAGLYEFWWQRIREMLDLGVYGFRCDAAYKVPVDLWKLLIGRAKEHEPRACFFAETLGCPFEDNLALTQAGFDFTFNSGKWWDYREDWFLDQLREGAGRTRSICFPESHDTERLMEEYRGDVPRVKQHYAFTALISSGVMIVMGFEYGAKKQVHVVKSTPDDWEGVNEDLTGFMKKVNGVKAGHRIFQEDNYVERVDNGTDNIMALKKTTLDKHESVLMLLNLYGQRHGCSVGKLKELGFNPSDMLLGEVSIQENELVMNPWGFAVLRQG